MNTPTVRSLEKWQLKSGDDFLQLVDPSGTTISWIDSDGLPQGNLATGGGGGTPALPLGSVQFNNAGAFGGSEIFQFDPTMAPIEYNLRVGPPTSSLDPDAQDYWTPVTVLINNNSSTYQPSLGIQQSNDISSGGEFFAFGIVAVAVPTADASSSNLIAGEIDASSSSTSFDINEINSLITATWTQTSGTTNYLRGIISQIGVNTAGSGAINHARAIDAECFFENYTGVVSEMVGVHVNLQFIPPFTATNVSGVHVEGIGGFGDFTNTNLYGLLIEDQVNAGSNIWAIKTGIGLVELGDALKVDGDIGFFGTTPVAKQTVSGAKLPSDTVMASLLLALAAYGIIVDSTT